MGNVVKIIGDPLLDFGPRVRRPSPPEHLGEACDLGPHAMPGMIVADTVGEAMAVHGVGAWPHKRHASKKDIQQLRELVDAEFADPFADRVSRGSFCTVSCRANRSAAATCMVRNLKIVK